MAFRSEFLRGVKAASRNAETSRKHARTFILDHGYGLAREKRLVNLEMPRPNHAAVNYHLVAAREFDNVVLHDIRPVDALLLAAANNVHLFLEKQVHAVERALRLELLINGD